MAVDLVFLQLLLTFLEGILYKYVFSTYECLRYRGNCCALNEHFAFSKYDLMVL